MLACMHIRIHVCIYVCMLVCNTCMCVCICAYIHTCMHAYIHTYIYIHVYTCIHTYIRTYVRTYIHTYIHIYICTYKYTSIHTYIHIYICTYKYTSIHTCTHARMRAHTVYMSPNETQKNNESGLTESTTNGQQRTFAVDSVPVLLALASIVFLLMSDQPLRFRLDFTDHQHTGNTFLQVSSVAVITLVTY